MAQYLCALRGVNTSGGVLEDLQHYMVQVSLTFIYGLFTESGSSRL